MQNFPHYYAVTATSSAPGPAGPSADVELVSQHVPLMRSASPAEFGGPGDRWSPETLLVASLGDCLILTFHAIARASKLAWTSIFT